MTDGLFIVSTGRCGSTLLSRILGRHPDLISVSELFSAIQPYAFPRRRVTGAEFWRLISEPHPLWTMALCQRCEPPEFLYPVDDPASRFSRTTGVPPIAAICLPTLTSRPDDLYSALAAAVPRFPEARVGILYQRLFGWLTRRLGRKLWLERSGGSLAYVEDIAREFPEAKFLHLYRDGQDVAMSMSRHQFFRLQLPGQRLGDEEGLAAGPRASRNGGGSESPRDPRHPLPEQALLDDAHRVPVSRFGLRWAATVLRGMATLTTLPPERVLHVAYEELVHNPRDTFKRTLTFFDVEAPSDSWLDRVATSVKPRQLQPRRLSAQEQEKLERLCGVGTRAIKNALAAQRSQ